MTLSAGLVSVASEYFAPLFDHLGARALSQDEMRYLAVRDAPLMQQAAPSVSDMLAQKAYRRPVVVPTGWADWYDCGDLLQ